MSVPQRPSPMVTIALLFCLHLLTQTAHADEWTSAKNVFDNRCVACHSCYTSPCQINLSSYEGLRRGGSKDRVYDGTRLKDLNPTRLYIDAHSTADWRKVYNFYPVIPENQSTDSMLMEAVTLGRTRGLQYRGMSFDTNDDLVCAADTKEWRDLMKKPGRGMPYGLPPISDADMSALTRWAKAGYPGKDVSYDQAWQDMDPHLQRHIRDWETLLNQDDLKSQIVARYLYEHLFLAHITFSDADGSFFRLIRSRRPSPTLPDEIATVRPYDSPGNQRVYYRFVNLPGTTMHKDHILFRLDADHMRFVKERLIGGKWVQEPKKMPEYGQAAGNAILAFQDMPARARYEFFLNDARYFVMSFIRGPVCEGQIALNVIQDQFAVFFLDPDFDLSVNDDKFLLEAAPLLTTPAAVESEFGELSLWRYKEAQREYLRMRARRYDGKPVSLNAVWDGDGQNDNAALTVFRHFDNAGVVKGIWAGEPKTVWVMDYPIFERMYYLLVAGFNVFGNVFHQGNTRMYMDNLRIESEDNFLYLMSEKMRRPVRSYWYEGSYARSQLELMNPLYSSSYPTALPPLTKSRVPQEIVTTYLDTLLTNRIGLVNKGSYAGRARIQSPTDDIGKALARLEGVRGGYTSFMPELTVLMINGKSPRAARTFFLSKIVALTNVSFPIGERLRRIPQDDRLAVVENWIGSYPNFIVHLEDTELAKFVNALVAAKDEVSVRKVLAQYGMTRDNENFWQTYDQLNTQLRMDFPVEFGRIDLSKYENIY